MLSCLPKAIKKTLLKPIRIYFYLFLCSSILVGTVTSVNPHVGYIFFHDVFVVVEIK